MLPSGMPAERLLDWIDRYGSIGKVQRRWEYFRRDDKLASLFPSYPVPYLYRGQNRRHQPCLPSICRPIATGRNSIRPPLGSRLAELPRPDLLHLLARLIRADWFCALLKQHPVLKWANEERLFIDRMALAQHYGIPTGYVDLTESLEIAVFFATCEFRDNAWQPCEEGTGILYRLDWHRTDPAIRDRARPIGLQPFARPRQQWAWTLELLLGEDVEDLPAIEAVQFEHRRRVGEQVLALVGGGEGVLPPDPIADWAEEARRSTTLPKVTAAEMIEDLSKDDYGLDAEDIDSLLHDIEEACSVRFSGDTPQLIDTASLAEIARRWEFDKPSFLAEVMPHSHFRMVRERKP